ncbi:GDP-mannose 4,6-dehydratase [Desulforhopalus singaporensis]|uniref:GDP-mannose 4,6 dehydratase n=1 Tax=Desulforhopalus singaporensis TaxID=91360 RepID=A0A1H0QSG8_9BACT|nr:GDP-mannose 4,6-dehydratase [Desulforhopalus singaporensis]SDP19656.1 GDP-mannose 4,6 dehydratase [Desulforhopalus singaporensis]
MTINRLLIFGTGFIANNYINHCIAEDPSRQIKVIFNKHMISSDSSKVEQILMNEDSVREIIESFQPTNILCLHGNSFVPNCLKIRDAIEDNALKTMDFLEIVHNSDAKAFLEKILIIGSASEYGKYYKEAIRENYPLHATSLYGLSKISLYNASMYYFDRGLPVVYVRQFNTTGADQRDCFVLSSFCKQIVEIEKGIKTPEILVGDLSQERDFIDIRDTCLAYSLLFEKGKIGEVYNVSSGELIMIKDLLDLIIRVADLDVDVNASHREDLCSTENVLSRRLHADITKLRNLGFKTKYQLSDIVLSSLNYWRKNV